MYGLPRIELASELAQRTGHGDAFVRAALEVNRVGAVGRFPRRERDAVVRRRSLGVGDQSGDLGWDLVNGRGREGAAERLRVPAGGEERRRADVWRIGVGTCVVDVRDTVAPFALVAGDEAGVLGDPHVACFGASPRR